jgi:hypothetical protein
VLVRLDAGNGVPLYFEDNDGDGTFRPSTPAAFVPARRARSGSYAGGNHQDSGARQHSLSERAMNVMGPVGLLSGLLTAATPMSAQCHGGDWVPIPTETVDIPLVYLHDPASGAMVVIGKGPSPFLKSRVGQVARREGATVHREVRDGWVSEVAVQSNAPAAKDSGLACDPSSYSVEIAAQLTGKAATLEATGYACTEGQRLRLLQLLASPNQVWNAVRGEWPLSQRVSEVDLSRVREGMCWQEVRTLLGTPTVVHRERAGFSVYYSGHGSASQAELTFDQSHRLAKQGHR